MVTRGIPWNEINTIFTYYAHTHTHSQICCESGLSKDRHQHKLYWINKEIKRSQIKEEAIAWSSKLIFSPATCWVEFPACLSLEKHSRLCKKKTLDSRGQKRNWNCMNCHLIHRKESAIWTERSLHNFQKKATQSISPEAKETWGRDKKSISHDYWMIIWIIILCQLGRQKFHHHYLQTDQHQCLQKEQTKEID